MFFCGFEQDLCWQILVVKMNSDETEPETHRRNWDKRPGSGMSF